MTRTDVNSAELEFTTNRERRKPEDRREDYRDLANDDSRFSKGLESQEIKSAVFASMDIPPAFKRMRGPDRGEVHQYEDGGVIDNLPIRFATWLEGCNLLFIFPLNATFEEKSTGRSILNLITVRLARIRNIRQGVLEHDALKDISLYNQIVSANRDQTGKLHTKPVTTFCICPAQPEIGTFGFWKLRRHAAANYDLMYETTKKELERFDFSPNNHEVWMAIVNRDHTITYKNFTVGQ